ncbi:Uncharacterized protein dnm_007610 [Desulfonema magnum]|uniref:Uncharacterized protein n=1 Tax=Desulfonema magnum TaxID=45655 RepID=A0A975GKI8_9BACT|nr:Uncharacterized protein dnm_007610 [Desulfonema magnum]
MGYSDVSTGTSLLEQGKNVLLQFIIQPGKAPWGRHICGIRHAAALWRHIFAAWFASLLQNMPPSRGFAQARHD